MANKSSFRGERETGQGGLSKAYTIFERVVERSLNLISLQKTLDKFMANEDRKPDLSDLSRASVVLAVAAMDAYFTDVFTENLVKFLKCKGAQKELTALLSRAGLDTAMALELLAMNRPYRRVRTLIETYMERQTTQHPEAIDELFLGYGIKDFCSRAEGIAKRKRLIPSIRKLVKRRHQIAHDGDINSRGKLRPIDPEQTRRRVQDLVKFIAASEKLLQNVLP